MEADESPLSAGESQDSSGDDMSLDDDEADDGSIDGAPSLH